MDLDDRFSSVNDDISGLVDSLRQAGTERELRNESSAVDAIVSMPSTEGTSMTPRFTGKARIASFVAAGIIGFGGVAAAGPAVIDQIDGDDEPTTTIADEIPTTDAAPATTIDETATTEPGDDDTVSTEPAITTTTAPEVETTTTTEVETTTTTEVEEPESDEVLLVDDPDTAFDETDCADGNHGKTVSSVARSEGRTSQDVVDAAQSSCGKDNTSDDDRDDEVDDDDSDDEVDDDDSDENDDDVSAADSDDDTSQDQGRSNGNSNGGANNGNGRGGNDNSNGGGGGGNGNGNGNGNGRSGG